MSWDIALQYVLAVVVILEWIGSIALLIYLRRLTRRWWAAFGSTLVAVPIGGFLLTGGVMWLCAVLEVVFVGVPVSHAQPQQTALQYLGMTFFIGGCYGVLFAGTGFGLLLVPFGLWGMFHPSSFCRITRWDS